MNSYPSAWCNISIKITFKPFYCRRLGDQMFCTPQGRRVLTWWRSVRLLWTWWGVRDLEKNTRGWYNTRIRIITAVLQYAIHVNSFWFSLPVQRHQDYDKNHSILMMFSSNSSTFLGIYQQIWGKFPNVSNACVSLHCLHEGLNSYKLASWHISITFMLRFYN